MFRKLLLSDRYEFLFWADSRGSNTDGVKLWDAPGSSFQQCPFFRIGPIVVQVGLIEPALKSDIDALIILGAFHWPMNWVAAILARLAGKPVYFWTHGWLQDERGLRSWLRNTFYRLGQGLLLYGTRARAIGIAQGFDGRRLHVIYNSLDSECHRRLRQPLDRSKAISMRKELFGNDTIPVVACCSRLTQTRRLDLLLLAAAKLQDAQHPVAVLLIGDGPEREGLEKQARKLNVPTHFYGDCYDEQTLYDLISTCNATVAPGKVGLTAIQSLSFGTPVITHGTTKHQMPEFEAIIPGITGDFFEEGSIDSLGAAIRSWTATAIPQESVRAECFAEIDRFWNPAYQVEAIERALDGMPAANVKTAKEFTDLERKTGHAW